MPIYEYRCARGHVTEILHKVSESGPRVCRCGAALERLFSPPAIRFHGPGFHNTDYGVGPHRGKPD